MIYLTKKQLEEIARQIAGMSVKDSDFDETETIQDDDFVAIVQDGINKRINIETLREGIARGEQGPPGEDGKSAYQIACDHGYVGTEEQWLNSLEGDQGPAGVGVPAGGSQGQVLAKSSGSDYATTWVDQTGGGGSGSVTSVAMTVPTGLSVSGSPVTTSGTLAVTYASGYSIPTTTKQGQWDAKQDALVSGTNIKTINGASILGSGDLTVSGSGMNAVKCTPSQYAAWAENDQLQEDTLYVIVDDESPLA